MLFTISGANIPNSIARTHNQHSGITTHASTMASSSVPGQKSRQVWTPEEDQLLSEAVARETPKHGPVSWHKVASHLPGRNNKDCRKRWHYSVANTIRKGTWMQEEDERLREAVGRYGTRWSKIAEAVGTRNGDQCWKRWYDCLDPRIDKSPWTSEEDTRLLQLVSQCGRNWSDIVHQHFPNRTSLSAKNRYSILRRKQEGAAPSSTNPARHVRSNTGASSSSYSPPTSVSATMSPNPYLGVPGTPSTIASFTPEPEFPSGEWMAFNNPGTDELSRQSSSSTTGAGSWYQHNTLAVSAESSPEMGHGLNLAPGDYTSSWPAGVSSTAWSTTNFDPHSDAAVSQGQMQLGFNTTAMDYQTGYPAQGQPTEAAWYGYDDGLGLYQADSQDQPMDQGLYAAGTALGNQGGMNEWQGGYNTETW